jgi:rhomboid protease GluP
MDEPQPVVIRQTQDPTLAQDWALVLTAAGIAHDLRLVEGQFALTVEAQDLATAHPALDGFDAERAADRVAPAPRPVPDGQSALGIAAALLLLAFYFLAGARETAPASRWFEVGSASAEQILRGQWWRAVTALTLHADLLHLFGNAVACLIFVTAVGRWLGSGLGAVTLLAAGAAGNLMTAWVHRSGHVSVGASTATFAALGILAGLGALRRFRWRPQRRRAWLPIAAALGMFAMLGVGEVGQHVDVFAHLFGLAAGCLLGLAAGLAVPQRPGRIVQATLASAAAAALAGCWWLAFHA